MKTIPPLTLLLIVLATTLPWPAIAAEKQPADPELIAFLGEFKDEQSGDINPLVFLNISQETLESLQESGGDDEKE